MVDRRLREADAHSDLGVVKATPRPAEHLELMRRQAGRVFECRGARAAGYYVGMRGSKNSTRLVAAGGSTLLRLTTT
jgi:hypothetical protein